MPRPKPILNIPDDEILRLYEEEQWTPGEIAREAGCHPVTLRGILRELGVEFGPVPKQLQGPEVAAKRRRERGLLAGWQDSPQ
jgi:AraC-like DNA-binding protein